MARAFISSVSAPHRLQAVMRQIFLKSMQRYQASFRTLLNMLTDQSSSLVSRLFQLALLNGSRIGSIVTPILRHKQPWFGTPSFCVKALELWTRSRLIGLFMVFQTQTMDPRLAPFWMRSMRRP